MVPRNRSIQDCDLRWVNAPRAAGPRRLDTEFFEYKLASLDPDGDRVLLVDDGGFEDIGLCTQGPLYEPQLTLFDADFETVLRKRPGEVSAIDFDPHSRRFVFGTPAGTIRAWAPDGEDEYLLVEAGADVERLFCTERFSAALVQSGTDPHRASRLFFWDRHRCRISWTECRDNAVLGTTA